MLEVDLGGYLNQPVREIMERAQTALLYVSGQERKWERHEDWDPITYQEFKRLVEPRRPDK